MSNPSVPKALYQANVDLALRIAALLQEHGQQWFDLFADEAGVRLGQGLAGMDRFRHEFPIDRLASLPAELAGSFPTLDAERWKTLLSKAIGHQARFSDGVQGALESWRESCSQVLGKAMPAEALPDLARAVESLPGLGELFAPFQQLMAQTSPRAASTVASDAPPASGDAKGSGKSAARKSPVAKSAPEARVAKKNPSKPKQGKAETSGKSPANAASKADATASAAPKPVAGKPAKADGARSKRGPARFPSPVPALVTTPRPRGKA